MRQFRKHENISKLSITDTNFIYQKELSSIAPDESSAPFHHNYKHPLKHFGVFHYFSLGI